MGLGPASARLHTGIELVKLVEAGERVLVHDFIPNAGLPASERAIFGKWLVTTERLRSDGYRAKGPTGDPTRPQPGHR